MSGIPLLFIYFRLVFEHRGGEADRRGTIRLATGIQAAYRLPDLFHFSFGTCLKSNNIQNMN